MATINLSEIEDKYGAVINKPAPQIDVSNLQSIADKYGATINPPTEPSVFAGTKQILGELKEDPLSLDVEPKEILNKAWETIKGSVANLAETQKEWIESFGRTPGVSEEIGKTLEVVAATAGVLFSPISAFFEGANEIPVVGSVSKLVTAAFSGLGEGGAAIGEKAVELLPIPQKAKENIREGVKEISSLAAQIGVGGRLGKKVLSKKKTELTEKFGEKGADTIIGKATEATEQKVSIGKPKVGEKVVEKPVEQIAQTQDNLIQEAKKFKTAEEFAKANIKPDFNSLPPDLTIKLSDKRLKAGNEVIKKDNPLFKDIKKAIASGEELPPIRVRIDRRTGDFIVKDGNNRVAAMKDLGIKEVTAYYDRQTLIDIWDKAKTEPVQPVPETVPVVDRVGEVVEAAKLPETKTGVETIAKAASDINIKIVEKGFKDLLPEEQAKFNSITIKDQLNKVANLMDTDLNKAIEMAAGKEPIPADINSQILFNSIAKKATADLDIGTLRRLADSPIAAERSIAAQTLGAAGVERLIENDPVRVIREIEKIKGDAVKSRNKDVAKTSKAEAKKVKETIRKSSAGKLADFIENLKC